MVAVVAGATRGAGRGIARALGEAAATVYCTGRSVRGLPSPYRRPETIEEITEKITAAAGAAFTVRVDHVDHTVETEVEACSHAWNANLANGETIFRQSLLSHNAAEPQPRPLANARGSLTRRN
jgi:NAD(P)-dependent dehydrogenase (short-subunit alcohol dehydrogenase family)